MISSLDLGIAYVVDKGPAYAAAAAGVDEAVLRAGVEGILAVDKLRVQHHVALLRLALEVGQTLPVLEVLGACYAASGCGGRQVARTRVIVTLHAEETVDPSVLVSRQTHVIHVGGRIVGVGHRDGTLAEAEVVHTVGALGYGKI